MSLVVHQMPHSPFCIPVTAALTAMGVPFTTREVPNWDRRELLALTDGDYYQVPVLVDGDRVVYESGPDTQDVARYLDTLYAAGRLFPGGIEGAHLCVIDFLENECEARGFKLADIHYVPAIQDAGARGMVVRHKERRFGRGCVEQWRADATALRAELDGLLARFEDTLRVQTFLFGESPVYADFLLHGIIGNFTWSGWNTLHETQRGLRAFEERVVSWRF